MGRKLREKKNKAKREHKGKLKKGWFVARNALSTTALILDYSKQECEEARNFNHHNLDRFTAAFIKKRKIRR